jgi:hypothetical protein
MALKAYLQMKVDHLGKVRSSFNLDPSILEEAKIASARRHMTVGYIIEEALIQYLKPTEIKVRRQLELDQQNAEHLKRLDMLKQQQEDRDRQRDRHALIPYQFRREQTLRR